MSDEEVYQRLARHLDRLPGGFPSTPDGLELRILKRLFSPEEAALAVHLTLLPERLSVIALRAGLPEEQVGPMLDDMAARGLLVDLRKPDRPTRYMASQFVVGIWEYQVNRLTPELVRDVDEYLKVAFDFDVWRKAPQLRTIPVGESLPAPGEVLLYENAAAMIQSHTRFAVAPCICRQERELVGESCGKPMETCLMMGGGVDFYLRYGRAREIPKEEALHILEIADRAGLVLQPGNARQAGFICCCCGDCCGVLRNIKRHPKPASVLSSAYFAVNDADLCSLCMDCEDRCQMEAISYSRDHALVDLDRCIGCGLCVTTCPSGAMTLQRKPDSAQPHVPESTADTYLQLARVRGVIGPIDLAKMVVKSAVDRTRAG
jgi:electron transport complex protein RnfB